MIKSKEQFTMELCHKIEKDIANDWYSPTDISKLLFATRMMWRVIKQRHTNKQKNPSHQLFRRKMPKPHLRFIL